VTVIMTDRSKYSSTTGAILVTGGTGFIGRHLVREVARDKPRSVIRVLTRRADAAALFEQIPNVECVTGDLCEPAAAAPHFQDVVSVFHLAGLKGEPDSARPAELFRRINVDATRTLLDLSAQAGVSRFVLMSSTGVFGNNGVDHCTEDTPCSPGNLYERTKLEAENVVSGYRDAPGLRRLILRPSNVFGEDHPQRHLLTLMKSIASGRFGLLRRKEAWVNYVYVKDVSQAAVDLARQERSGTYIVNDASSMADFIDLIRAHLSSAGRVHRYPYLPTLTTAAALDVVTRVTGVRFPLTVSKVRELANTQVFVSDRVKTVCPEYPVWGLETGLRTTIERYQAQGWL
jgi:UDP-glucose 4-epimerase